LLLIRHIPVPHLRTALSRLGLKMYPPQVKTISLLRRSGISGQIESLKKTIESHLGAASIGADEEKWKEKTLIVEKTISLARWLNSSSETDQTEAVRQKRKHSNSDKRTA
jgi:hypothetical protein